ncbi:MAG: hypothetical protein WCF97_11815, partial [Nitrososphaeraceae archaeon]
FILVVPGFKCQLPSEFLLISAPLLSNWPSTGLFGLKNQVSPPVAVGYISWTSSLTGPGVGVGVGIGVGVGVGVGVGESKKPNMSTSDMLAQSF